jgi:hypothetical protein
MNCGSHERLRFSILLIDLKQSVIGRRSVCRDTGLPNEASSLSLLPQYHRPPVAHVHC